MNNEKIISFLERAIYKNLKEIEKINEYVNDLGELGPVILDGHIKYRDQLINSNKEYEQKIKQLKNESHIRG